LPSRRRWSGPPSTSSANASWSTAPDGPLTWGYCFKELIYCDTTKPSSHAWSRSTTSAGVDQIEDERRRGLDCFLKLFLGS
jgi:hypothetical protein